MAIKIAAPGLSLIIIMIVVLFALVMPLSPVMTVTVQIQSRGSPAFSATQALYQRIPLSSALGAQRDTPVLTVLSANAGTMSLQIVVSYKGSILTSYVFQQIGDGIYQIKVTYLINTNEDRTTPYLLQFILSQDSTLISQFVLNILPA